jgi:hypothetical protein
MASTSACLGISLDDWVSVGLWQGQWSFISECRDRAERRKSTSKIGENYYERKSASSFPWSSSDPYSSSQFDPFASLPVDAVASSMTASQ